MAEVLHCESDNNFGDFNFDQQPVMKDDTATSSMFSSQSSNNSGSRSSHKSKKSKKSKKSSSRESSSNRPKIEHKSYSKQLFAKMLDDNEDNSSSNINGASAAFSDAFGDFNDIDAMDPDVKSQQSSVKDHQSYYSRESAASRRRREHRERHSYSSSASQFGAASERGGDTRTRTSDGTPKSRNGSTHNSHANTGADFGDYRSRANTKDMDDILFSIPNHENFFTGSEFDTGWGDNANDDDDEDDDSIRSDITGLTGIFSRVHTDADFSDGEKTDVPRVFFSASKNSVVAPTVASTSMGETDESSKRSRKSKTSLPKNGNNNAKSVQFGQIELRYYERILTHNPSTISGPSVGIGWGFTRSILLGVDEYEQERGPPRPSSKLVLHREKRENLLYDLGYTQKELAVAVRLNTKARNQRRQTVQNVKAEKMEEKLESAGKGLKRMFKLGRKSKSSS